MYIKNISIKNIGPISELSVEMPFDKDGNPKPIIFVGENGSGKTILQSQVVDSFYEIGSNLFEDVGKQKGFSRNYYKLSGGINLQVGKEQGFSALVFSHNNGEAIEYLDKVGNVKKEDITGLLPNFLLSSDGKNGNQKTITNINDQNKETLQKEWLEGAYFYQPAYRYEEPFWKNDPFLDNQKFTEKRNFSNNLGKEFEIISSSKNNKAYLMDLVLDFTINKKNIIDQVNWQNINNILRNIKRKNNIRFGIGPRGAYRVSIVEQNPDGSMLKKLIPSIDHLSLGESILLNLFINIVRHSDNTPKQMLEIKGIVSIDEIDIHLHTDLQYLVLPELIKSFPRVQFVITTHSPLFLLGMKKVFGEDGFELRNMPDGEVINTERFSEFDKAYQILKSTEKFEKEISSKIKETALPTLFVEGDYDIRYITKAVEIFDKTHLLKQIKIMDANGFGGLDKIWKSYNSELAKAVPQKILLLYDCDTEKQNVQRDMVFKRIIPSINTSCIKKGIENLFPNKIIEDAKKYKSAFIDFSPEIVSEIRGQNKVTPESYSVNKDEKGNLCEWICVNGNKKDFKNFLNIINMIEKILIETDEK